MGFIMIIFVVVGGGREWGKVSLWIKAKRYSWNDLSLVLFRINFHETMTKALPLW